MKGPPPASQDTLFVRTELPMILGSRSDVLSSRMIWTIVELTCRSMCCCSKKAALATMRKPIS
jgi:hypothetical protein